MAKKNALIAAQPTIGVKSKTQIAANATFASVAGDPSQTCLVSLKFRDSNGNGTLDVYEDWTQTVDVRTADLLAKMSSDQKLALMVHAVTDPPTASVQTISTANQTLISSGIRFGTTAAPSLTVAKRATWAVNLQTAAEATALGVPFVLSSEPIHSQGNGRTHATGLSQWPQELGLGATSTSTVKSYGAAVAAEYRAIGITMALSPSADLDTDPRWFNGQFTFGEDSATVSAMAGAYVAGLQGTSITKTSVAAVVGHFPGSGATTGGWDSRLVKGKFLTYPGSNADAHFSAFAGALTAGAAGVMPSYGIPQTGSWTAAGGTVSGTSIEQVGASFNRAVLTDVLRTHDAFGGLVVAPLGVTLNAGTAPLGAPWGVESMTQAQRIGKAVNAGVDQFVGLQDTSALTTAKTAALFTDAQVSASAGRALKLIFQLGLFENPYVDPTAAGQAATANYSASLTAMDASMVLVTNATKPNGWLEGMGDGTQMGDKGNAGNGSQRVLPAPPGEPYVSAGCKFFVGAGNLSLDYVSTVAAGYGELTNYEDKIAGANTPTDSDKMAASDYIFIRISAPFTADTDSGPLNYSLASLQYKSSDNNAVNAAYLQPIIDARNAIMSHPGSQAQIVVGVDNGRPSVLSEIQAYNVSGIYEEWAVSDKVFLDVLFGIVTGTGKLPVGNPASDAAAASQNPDVAGDGTATGLARGAGYQTTSF